MASLPRASQPGHPTAFPAKTTVHRTDARGPEPRDPGVSLSRHVEPRPTVGARLTEGPSAAYRAAIRQLLSYARYDDVPVLLVGESGTGKTMLAEHVHRASPRARGEFHRVAISSLPESLVSSELFGHVRGSFSGAIERRAGHLVVANHGTLFLDEIGKASEAIQYKLLDVIERKQITPVGADRALAVDVRIVAATNVPLTTLVAERRFLPDLWARMRDFVVTLPPLRARRADIPALATHFVAHYAGRYGYGDKPPRIDPELMNVLCTADWPDNIRQLEGVLRNILIAAERAPVLATAHCTYTDLRVQKRRRGGQLERAEIEIALADTAGDPDLAALALGVSRATLYRDAKAAGMPSVGSKRSRTRTSQPDVRQSRSDAETPDWPDDSGEATA